jgi:hypothetical protein
MNSWDAKRPAIPVAKSCRKTTAASSRNCSAKTRRLQTAIDPNSQTAPNRTNRTAVGVLALVALLVFWPWLFTGQAFYWGDFGLYFRPMTALLREQLSHGRLPLWNPYLFSGAPYIGTRRRGRFIRPAYCCFSSQLLCS